MQEDHRRLLLIIICHSVSRREGFPTPNCIQKPDARAPLKMHGCIVPGTVNSNILRMHIPPWKAMSTDVERLPVALCLCIMTRQIS